MDALMMNKQAIQFQKTMFDTSCETMKTLQSQMDNIVAFWQKQMGMPETAQMSIVQWTGMVNKARDDFKRMVDDGFDKMEEFLASSSEGKKNRPTSMEP